MTVVSIINNMTSNVILYLKIISEEYFYTMYCLNHNSNYYDGTDDSPPIGSVPYCAAHTLDYDLSKL